jgi:hypothetical protein
MAVKAAMVTKTVSGEDEDKFFRFPWWGRVIVIARSPEGATKQSRIQWTRPLDCFAPLAMTVS